LRINVERAPSALLPRFEAQGETHRSTAGPDEARPSPLVGRPWDEREQAIMKV
jgi:hypothetical protein